MIFGFSDLQSEPVAREIDMILEEEI